MKAHYGYTDGSGEYYITIDTDKCTGCGNCVEACPKCLFEIIIDDYDQLKVEVKQGYLNSVSYICPGYHGKCIKNEVNCHVACPSQAISHSW